MEPGVVCKYVRIDPRFSLRGWLDQPYTVLDGLTASVHPVSKNVFDTLQMYNGRFRPNDAVFLGGRKALIAQLEREGVLSFTDEPSSLAPDQEYRFYPNRYMRQAYWSLTGKCNYRYRHCFNAAENADRMAEWDWDGLVDLLDQAADCGFHSVTLTGGEPMLHPAFSTWCAKSTGATWCSRS